MKYRVMDDYIQKQNDAGLWQNIARVVDMEDCLVISARGNLALEFENVMDGYLAGIVSIESRFSKSQKEARVWLGKPSRD